MNTCIQDLFEDTIGVINLPITLRVKFNGGIGLSAKNILKFTANLSCKPGITIMNKLF